MLAIPKENNEEILNKLLADIQKAISESEFPLKEIYNIFDTEYRGEITFESFGEVVKKIAPKYSDF